RRITDEVFSTLKLSAEEFNNSRTLEEKKKIITQFEKKLDSAAVLIYEARSKSPFTFNLGYNQKFFSILSYSSDDALADSLNYFGTESNTISLGFSKGFNFGESVFGATYFLSDGRKDASKGQI